MSFDETYFRNLYRSEDDQLPVETTELEDNPEVKKKIEDEYSNYFRNLYRNKDNQLPEKSPIKVEEIDNEIKVKKPKVKKDTPIYLSDYIMNKWANTSNDDEKIAYVDSLGVDMKVDPYKTRLDELDTKKLAKAMAKFEGYYNEVPEDSLGTRAQRNFNPGNIAYFEAFTSPGGILEKATDTDGEFAIFGNEQDGWDAMHRQIDLDKRRAAEKFNLDDMSKKSLEGIIPSVVDLHSMEGIESQKEDRFSQFDDNMEFYNSSIEPSKPIDLPSDVFGNLDLPHYGYEYNTETGEEEKVGVIDGNGNIVTDEKVLKNFFAVPEPDEFGMFPPSYRIALESQGYKGLNLKNGIIQPTHQEKEEIIKYEHEILDAGIHEQLQDAYEKAGGDSSALMFSEVSKHVGYKMASLTSLGYSKKLMDKPIITKLLDRNLTGIQSIDDPTYATYPERALNLARGLNGVGNLGESLVHMYVMMRTMGATLPLLGVTSPTLTNAAAFAAHGLTARLTDTNNKEHMTAKKWFAYTAADGIMGGAFGPLSNIGGPLITTQGGYVKVLTKLLAQSSVLTGGMTSIQFATNT